MELEASRGFIRKIRGKTKTHLMAICYTNRGRFMKITEIVTKRKPLMPLGRRFLQCKIFLIKLKEFQRRRLKIFRRVRAFTEDVGPTQTWLQREDLGMELCCQLENGPEL